MRLSFRPVVLEMPKGLSDPERWKLVRRAWFNVFQMSAEWGDKNNPVSAPAGVLSNNVISDPVSCCLFVYADSASGPRSRSRAFPLWSPSGIRSIGGSKSG